jgi:ATPase subunit of ABC transporter with duplicated ATPase domains
VDGGRERLSAARARVEGRERLSLALPPSGVPAGKTVLEMDSVTYAHPGAPEPLIRDFSLRIVGPERVAVVGPNGSGKTTLLHLALGRLAPSAGTVRLGVAEREAAFFDQHARRLRPALSVLENYRAANPEMDETQSRLVLARFLFPDEAALQPAATLSGGQRLRAALACAVNGLRPPKLLVLDEPTNHLDLDSLDALEGILAGYDGALLVVSHDAAFLEAVGIDRYVELERGALPGERIADTRFAT